MQQILVNMQCWKNVLVEQHLIKLVDYLLEVIDLHPFQIQLNLITIATTGNASDFGDLVVARRSFGGLASPTRGNICVVVG